MCGYGACLCLYLLSDCLGVCGKVCCVVGVVEDSGLLALEC